MTELLTEQESELRDNEAQANGQLAGFARLGMLVDHEADTQYPVRLAERIEARGERESEGVLSIEIERTVRIVLCTGGPHCEIRWPEHRDPTVVCFGWFGSARFERELTHEEFVGLEVALGDWETLAGEES